MGLAVDVSELMGQPGTTRHLHVAEPVEGLATELALVPADRAVSADLLLESVVEGVLVTGSVGGVMVLRCARCLTDVETTFDVGVQELFAPGASEDDDAYPVEEGTADLEPMIRDAVVTAMPFSPLCRPQCLGLCERCGGDRNLDECSCPPETDARWAALAELRLPDGPG